MCVSPHTADKLLTTFPGNVKLYEANSVHHRDPSVNNMMYRRDEHGRVIGILSDFDLAVSMTRSGTASSTHRSGTAPFMALDLLRSDPCKQELEHDFESALYIMVWVALGYKGWKPPLTGDPLSNWRRGTWSQICDAKELFINRNPDKDLLGLVNSQYQVLRSKISELHMEISWRVQSKMQEELARQHGKERPAVSPMTPQDFFNIIGPPPPGREPYCQTSIPHDLA
jgi:Fungal protein kinase